MTTKALHLMKIEHIGIAVKDIHAATQTYASILNTKPYKTELVDSEKVETVFFKTGESKVELLGATENDSVISKYVEKKGEGLHHVAFEVTDIHSELERLRSEGFTVLNDQPKKGADQKLVAFVHPKDNHGVLIELCQSIDQ